MIEHRIVAAYQKLPLFFEANHGQVSSEVTFLSRGPAYDLFLTGCRMVMALSPPAGSAGVAMTWMGANPFPAVVGLDALQSKSNYFIGNDPTKWRSHVPHFAKVRCRNLYPGVDIVYYGKKGQIEYDIIVAPGADPSVIELAFDGAEKVRVDPNGELALATRIGEVRLRKPSVYQELGGTREEVRGSYELTANDHVRFALTPYDSNRTLVIDPLLTYSTYLGGSGSDGGPMKVAVDGNGHAYVSGRTNSLDFPTADARQPDYAGQAGRNNGFVSKLSADGATLLFSTYIGGVGDDRAGAIAIDRFGNAYITGRTESVNFPTTPNSWQPVFAGGPSDAYVAKISPDGAALLYSTFVGGAGTDNGNGIAVGIHGNAYVTGATNSPDFPTVNPVQIPIGGGFDAFAASLTADGSLLEYSTFLGGLLEERGFAVAVDADHTAVFVGRTASRDFPTASPLQGTYGGGAFDGFVTKVGPDGWVLDYSTYLGGSADDQIASVAADRDGNAAMTGASNSADFPTVNALQPTLGGGMCGRPPRPCLDAVVAKINREGSALVYSTFLGGRGEENILDGGGVIGVDAADNAYVGGFTNSTDFPVTRDALQPFLRPGTCGSPQGPCFDAFLAKLDRDGSSLIYSTYFGGSSDDRGPALAVDRWGHIYLAGFTSSKDFPTLRPFQATFGGGADDVFVIKIAR